MRRLVGIFLAVIMSIALLSGCGNNTGESDSEYVKSKKKLVVGITEFPPMDYKEEGSGEWTGFDADMARAFAKSLGVEAEFVEIEWGNKIEELADKKIDCVWNGMTLTDEVTDGMDCTNPYCSNAQVVVLPSDRAAEFTDVESLKDLNFAVEAGGIGEEELEKLNYKAQPVKSQTEALKEVREGTVDAAVIDLLMAAAVIGPGTEYENLAHTVALNSEEYGVGFRRGSDLEQILNAFFITSYRDGSMQKLAEKYGVQDALVEQK